MGRDPRFDPSQRLLQVRFLERFQQPGVMRPRPFLWVEGLVVAVGFG
jgi:hypothetical protein